MAKKQKITPLKLGGKKQSYAQLVAYGNKQAAAKKSKLAKAAYDPTRPPTSMYDPALDAQERAGARGLSDLLLDANEGQARNTFDYGQAKAAANLNLSRGTEDYTRNVGNLDRSYAQRATNQGQSATAAGAASGGAFAQALAKRTENYGIDRAPLDTSFNRLGQDTTTQLGGLAENYRRQTADMFDPLLGKVPRAQREQAFFSGDVGQQRWYQARSQGYSQENQYEKPGVGIYRVSGGSNALGNFQADPRAKRRYTLPSGQSYSRGQWLKLLKKKR